MQRRDVLRAMGAALAAGSPMLRAQQSSQKPTRIVVPFPAGGTMDFVVRLVANDLSKRLSQVVIVENKPGAGTVIGVDSVAKAAPDGHSLVAIGNSFTVNHTLVSNLPYRSLEDLRPGMHVGWTPNLDDGARLVASWAHAGDTVLMLGAGDVDSVAPLLLEELA